jgi:hypothetical protein
MVDEVDSLFGDYGSKVRKLSMGTREMVFKLLPDAKEKAYLGLKVVWYSLGGGMKDGIVGISPQKKHVNLIFMRGAELEDPDKLLEGTGKKGRHVKIRRRGDIRNKSLKSLILASAKLSRR